MWSNIRIGIIGQGSQYNRISKILKTKDISFLFINHLEKKDYFDKEKLQELKKCKMYFYFKSK
jgi:hypothetical protein